MQETEAFRSGLAHCRGIRVHQYGTRQPLRGAGGGQWGNSRRRARLRFLKGNGSAGGQG